METSKVIVPADNPALNNCVENSSTDSVDIPNDETKTSIEESRPGKSAGTIDMSDFNSFMKSINDIR